MTRWGAVALAGLLILSGCQQSAPPARTLVAAPHYTLGAPYVANGHWYYPAENYALDTTGIASVQDAAAHVTADGEIYDAGALVAAMQTVQLPAVARVTNLENGREIAVRVNDRGPDDPARVIAVSPRAALLLLIPAGGAARVRVALDTRLSHAVVEQVGGGPKLAIATAPAGTVVAQALPPLGTGGAGAATVPSGWLLVRRARAEGCRSSIGPVESLVAVAP